jgi:hypothetical protein
VSGLKELNCIKNTENKKIFVCLHVDEAILHTDGGVWIEAFIPFKEGVFHRQFAMILKI